MASVRTSQFVDIIRCFSRIRNKMAARNLTTAQMTKKTATIQRDSGTFVALYVFNCNGQIILKGDTQK